MPDYIDRGGGADAGIAILGGLLVGLVLAAAVGSHQNAPEQPKKAEAVQTESKPVEQPKPAEKPREEAKPAEEPKTDDCAFYRTMYFVNMGKSMGSYYYVMWQNCENQ